MRGQGGENKTFSVSPCPYSDNIFEDSEERFIANTGLKYIKLCPIYRRLWYSIKKLNFWILQYKQFMHLEETIFKASLWCCGHGNRWPNQRLRIESRIECGWCRFEYKDSIIFQICLLHPLDTTINSYVPCSRLIPTNHSFHLLFHNSQEGHPVRIHTKNIMQSL